MPLLLENCCLDIPCLNESRLTFIHVVADIEPEGTVQRYRSGELNTFE
jgi:hypothetical protein